jgi:citrate lyase subunit beta/citryl-CoA lyase
MPGSNARALEKAASLPADALILDLEDSVAPEEKVRARVQVVAAIGARKFGRREVVFRANGLDTPWGEADLIAAATSGADAVLVPKIEAPEQPARARDILRGAGAPDALALWAMIETPLAILNAERLAAAGKEQGLSVLVIGTNDLAKATRARLVRGRAPMLPWLAAAVLAARAQDQDIIDGVFNDLGDKEGFRAECLQGRELGMDGKTLIHPGQIEAANDIFAPAPEEIAAARRILAAFAEPANRGKGVLTLDGRMVERLHAEMAERTVALADAIARN